MRVLVLDTIHGGAELAVALRGAGHQVDEVDVYLGQAGISIEEALVRTYDLVTAPVHLDPDHPLLRRHGPAVSHHEMVKWVLDGRLPHPFKRRHIDPGLRRCLSLVRQEPHEILHHCRRSAAQRRADFLDGLAFAEERIGGRL